MKKLIAGAIIAASVLLVGCSKTENTTTQETTIEGKTIFNGTVKDLLKKDENLICSFTFEDEKTKEEGTIYIYQGKIKSTGKVELKQEKTVMEANIITDDEYTYTRSNLQKNQGAKFKNLDKNDNQQYKEDPLNEKQLQFICEKTEIDEDIFKIPTGITFIDITDYLINK